MRFNRIQKSHFFGILLVAIGLFSTSNVSAQSVVVNKYQNVSTTADVIELLVIQDNTDLRNLWVKDFSSNNANDGGGGFQFTTNALWASVDAGTLIILRQGSSVAADVTISCTDFLLDVGLSNATYFNTGTGTFDIGTNDMVMIKSGTQAGVANNIHTLRGGTTGTQWTAIASGTKIGSTGAVSAGNYQVVLNATPSLADYNLGTTGATTNTGYTFGLGNNATNIAFINFLKGPISSAATSVSGTGFTANWSALTGASSYLLDVSTASNFSSFVGVYNGLNVGNVLTSAVTGLSPTTTYYFRVRAINATPDTSGNSCTQTVVTGSGGIVSFQDGPWNNTTTWIGGVIPVSTDNVIINHIVTDVTGQTRDLGTTTTVSTTGTLIIDNVTYTNNGATTINGIFQINEGGIAFAGNAFVYGAAGTLNFNRTGGAYIVNNTDAYWPITSGPVNVNVLQGGLLMNSANRTVSGVFSIKGSGVALTSSTLTLNGTCRIDIGGFFTNAPTYGSASTLLYNTNTAYNRTLEWSFSGVGVIGSDPGYPNNVRLSNNTIFNYNNGGAGTKAMNGSLTVDLGSHFDMNNGSSSLFPLIVAGNVTNAGTLTLGNQPGADLKLAGNFANTGTFNGNSRAIFFTKTGTQTVTSSSTLTIPYVRLAPTSGNVTVQLATGTNVIISANGGSTALTFNSAGDVFDINGNSLTIGTAATVNTITGAGTLKGSTTSNLTLLGTGGSVGTLNFTTGFENLGTFSVNRDPALVGCVLGTTLTVNTALTLTNGLIDLGANVMTLASTCSNTFGDSANSYVIADGTTVGANLRKNVTAAGTYKFPIGDNAASLNGTQYSPATVVFASGSFASAYLGVTVIDLKEPNFDAPAHYITRYWNVTSSGITSPNYTFSADYLPVDVVGTEAIFQGNQWDGSNWSNGGSPGGTNTFTIGGITTLPTTNHITKGLRAGDIYITDAVPTPYANNSTYAFGVQPTGTNTLVTFTIKNVGQQNLSFTAASVVNTLGAAFSFNTPFTTPVSVAPNATATFTIKFSPIAVTGYTGYVTFTSNDPDENPYIINFTGSGVTPIPEIRVENNAASDIPINSVASTGFDTKFAIQIVGSTSAAKTYRVRNLGNINLNITSIAFDAASANPGDFILAITSPAVVPGVVAPAGFMEFTIKFKPTAAGLRTAIVMIGNDDADESPYYFNIEGTGQGPEINVSGNNVAIASGTTTVNTTDNTQFGNVNITSGTSVKTFLIQNIGDAALTISSVALSGANAADFTISPSPVLTGAIAASASKTMTITFDPTTVGVKNATVTILSDDGDEATYTFAIQGNAVNYTPCALNVIQTIGQQDFEASPATPVMAYAVTQDSGAAAVVIGGGQARGQDRITDTNKFVGASSFQIAGVGLSSPPIKNTTVIFAPVDASTYSEVNLSFQLGAYITATYTQQGMDIGDKVVVSISTNGGTLWSPEMEITGKGNALWDINTSTGSAVGNYDGNSVTTVYAAGNGSLNTGPRTISLANIPNSSQLRVRIVFTVDRGDELWVMDNVKLEGKKPAISTWNSGWIPSAPTASVFAIINSPYNTALGDVNACSCQINAPVTVNSNQYLNIQSDIENNSTVTIESNGSLVQENDTASNTGSGSYVIKRATTSYNLYDYTYWSSPVTSATIGATFTGWRTDYAFLFNTPNFSDANLDGFDDDQNDWQHIGTGTTMDPGRGYAVMMPTAGYTGAATTVSFNGNVNNGLVQEGLLLSGNAATNDDFNLIGNPYPSAISADDFINANTNFAGTLYFWTHRLGISGGNPGPDMNNFITTDYAMYSLIGGVTTATPSGVGSTTPTGFVASGQGFFVEAVTPGNVNFTNSMRRNTGNNNFYRTSATRNETGEIQKDRIWLNMENANGLFSQQLIGYVADGTLGFDRGYDGIVSKAENTISFYSFIGEDEYRIQGRPTFDDSDIVPLGYSSNAAGSFTIGIGDKEGQLNNDNTQIFLEDKLLNIVHDLKQGAYVFTTQTGTFNNRFVLRYANSALGTPDFDNVAQNVVVASSNGEIRIKSYLETLKKVTIYDISGRQIFQKDNLDENEFDINDAVLSHQPLVVKIVLANGQVVNKKIVF